VHGISLSVHFVPFLICLLECIDDGVIRDGLLTKFPILYMRLRGMARTIADREGPNHPRIRLVVTFTRYLSIGNV
jgi:hypothetical protein